MKLPRQLLAAATFASLTAGVAAADAAPPPPRGKHPRIWLTDPTIAAMKAKLGDASSAVGKVVARCKEMASKPNRLTNGDDWTWSFGAPSCALAWKLTGDASYAATGVALFQALLDDNDKVGDGAGGDTVVRHDAGYDIRVFGPYAALCYDWLHDAPGVDAALLAHARERFQAWVDWYTQTGYLNDTPGSNYHAGYVFAKTLIAVAAAGEDSGVSDAYWTDVNDKIFATQLVKNGLSPAGALSGGDWPEGWQYGPLSVVSYALSARALEEQGSAQPEMRQWASDLTLAYLYAVPPKKDGVFTDGDLDNDQPLAVLNPRPLLATMAWGGSDQAAGFASSFRSASVTMREDNPVFEALAEARGAAPVDFESTKPSLWYLAKGTRKLYARSAWAPDATWAVFTAAPRLVPDHQHVDASNFVFARGADHLIADPSPYGSLSTLTGNALTVDSNTVEAQDKPSQSIWENASELPWARAVTSGIAASRADLAGAFSGRNNVKSDVPFARRDWAYLPEGDIVVIDRARTDDARKMHVRFRTPATLKVSSTAPYIANGGVGGSALFIHAVQLSGGAPKLRTVAGGGTCDGVTYGQCDAARFKVTEYFVDVPGPQMLAVHVMDGLGPSDQGPAALPMNDPAVDTNPPQNAGVVGASVRRGGTQNYVVTSSAKDGVAGATLTYGVPGDLASRHVVFDAPEDGAGKSNVKGTVANGRCVVTITAGSGASAFAGRPLVFSVASAAAGCTAAEDSTVIPGTVPPGGVTPGGGGGGGGGGGNGSGPGAASDSGCGCRAAPSSAEGWAAFGALAGVLAIGARRIGRKR